MTGRRSIAKNTPREKPQGVFDVQYYLFAAHVAVAADTAPAAPPACSSRPSRLSWSRPVRNPQPPARSAHVTLVNTSVYLKPSELVDVALDMLARLAPCLNLGVRELGHKDLLDTIGADNCRK